MLGTLSLSFVSLLSTAGHDAAASWVANGDFTDWHGGAPSGWQLCFDRPETAPGLQPKRGGKDWRWAALTPRRSGLSMGWLEQRIEFATRAAGEDDTDRWLEFSCRVRFSGDQHPVENIRVCLCWDRVPTTDKRWRPPRQIFVPLRREPGSASIWEARQRFPLLPGAPGLSVKLIQFGGTRGSVAFSRVRLLPVPAPEARPVKLAVACYVPRSKGDWARNLEGIDTLAKRAAGQRCDLVLFGEGVSVVGTGKSYVEVARPIPGPHSDDLAEVARRHSIFLCAGLYERDGDACYNTALLFDRTGRIVGTYRKVHLPFAELTGGLESGTEFPVFDTELGPIGMQVCYDHHFAESARCLALNGARLILTPIWGDMRSDGEVYEAVARARAVDNGVFYATSIYSNKRSLVVGPEGRILAETEGAEPTIAVAEIDLGQCLQVDQPYWIPANYQTNCREERRPSAYTPFVRCGARE